MFDLQRLQERTIFRIADQLYKIIAINIMTLVVALPIVTIGPAFIAGYERIRFYLDDRNEAPLVRSFLQSLKTNFLKRLLLGLVVLGVGGLLGWSWYYYYLQINNGLMFLIGLFIVSSFIFIFLMIIIQLPFVALYFPQQTIVNQLKLGLYFGLKRKLRTVTLLLLAIPSLLLIEYAMPVFAFIGVGIPIAISIKIMDEEYKKLLNRTEEE